MGNPAPAFFICHPSFFSVFNILIDKSPIGAYYLFQRDTNFYRSARLLASLQGALKRLHYESWLIGSSRIYQERGDK